MNIGILGAGGRGWHFAIGMSKMDGVDVVALCDTNMTRMKNVGEHLPGRPGYYRDPVRMLESEDLDGVVVATPDHCHVEHATAVLKAGVNVLIDKPLATTVAGCRTIIAAAEESGKTAMMGFNLRHDPTLRRLKSIVEEGVLGEIFCIENREFYDGGRTYMSRWNRRYEWSGGLWVHKGSHDFDIFNWLMGFPEPQRVSAFAGVNVFTPDNLPFEAEQGREPGPFCSECAYADRCPDRYEIGAFDASASHASSWGAEATAEDGYHKDLCMYLSDKDVHDNGIASVEYANGARASHLECFVTSFSDRRYSVIGDRGIADVSLADRTITLHRRWRPEYETIHIPAVRGGHGGADPSLQEAFIDVLRNNGTSTSTLEHGLWATAIGQAAEISRREQRMVEICELFE